jgi:hypothetical protein
MTTSTQPRFFLTRCSEEEEKSLELEFQSGQAITGPMPNNVFMRILQSMLDSSAPTIFFDIDTLSPQQRQTLAKLATAVPEAIHMIRATEDHPIEAYALEVDNDIRR